MKIGALLLGSILAASATSDRVPHWQELECEVLWNLFKSVKSKHKKSKILRSKHLKFKNQLAVLYDLVIANATGFLDSKYVTKPVQPIWSKINKTLYIYVLCLTSCGVIMGSMVSEKNIFLGTGLLNPILQ